MSKLYDLKLETKSGELLINNVAEFVFARSNLFYTTSSDQVGRVSRSSIINAYRKSIDSEIWSCVKPKLFK